jgi:hypothetical protein
MGEENWVDTTAREEVGFQKQARVWRRLRRDQRDSGKENEIKRTRTRKDKTPTQSSSWLHGRTPPKGIEAERKKETWESAQRGSRERGPQRIDKVSHHLGASVNPASTGNASSSQHCRSKKLS